jgi:hypothetical protein
MRRVWELRQRNTKVLSLSISSFSGDSGRYSRRGIV